MSLSLNFKTLRKRKTTKALRLLWQHLKQLLFPTNNKKKKRQMTNMEKYLQVIWKVLGSSAYYCTKISQKINNSYTTPQTWTHTPHTTPHTHTTYIHTPHTTSQTHTDTTQHITHHIHATRTPHHTQTTYNNTSTRHKYKPAQSRLWPVTTGLDGADFRTFPSTQETSLTQDQCCPIAVCDDKNVLYLHQLNFHLKWATVTK